MAIATMTAKEEQIRKDICRVCQMMYDRQLIGGPAGNVSVRFSEELFLMTPSISFKQFLTPDQVIFVNGQGEKVGPHTAANRELKPTSETSLHLEVYRQRPDVNSVVHAHPSHCVALTTAGIPLRPQVLNEGMLFVGATPTARYGTPTTDELSESISDLVTEHDAVLLAYHGAITLGADIWKAYSRMEVLEQTAYIQILVHSLGGEVPLPKESLEKLIALRNKMGMGLSSDPELLD